MQCPRERKADFNWGAFGFTWQLWQTQGKCGDVLQSDWSCTGKMSCAALNETPFTIAGVHFPATQLSQTLIGLTVSDQR